MSRNYREAFAKADDSYNSEVFGYTEELTEENLSNMASLTFCTHDADLAKSHARAWDSNIGQVGP